jgi:hypothetical protein
MPRKKEQSDSVQAGKKFIASTMAKAQKCASASERHNVKALALVYEAVSPHVRFEATGNRKVAVPQPSLAAYYEAHGRRTRHGDNPFSHAIDIVFTRADWSLGRSAKAERAKFIAACVEHFRESPLKVRDKYPNMKDAIKAWEAHGYGYARSKLAKEAAAERAEDEAETAAAQGETERLQERLSAVARGLDMAKEELRDERTRRQIAEEQVRILRDRLRACVTRHPDLAADVREYLPETEPAAV